MATTESGDRMHNISWVTAAVIASAVLVLTVLGLGAFTAPAADDSRSDLAMQPEMSQISRDIIYQTMGQDSGREVPKVQAVDIIGPLDGYVVLVRFAIASHDQTTPTREIARAEATALLKALYQSNVPVTSVSLSATYPMAQPYGQALETVVLKCTLDEASAGVNWSTVSSAELFSVMDDVWWHPSLDN